jgi:hypothetical protein
MGTGYNIPVSLSQATDLLNEISDDLATNVNFGSGSLFGASTPSSTGSPNTTATASTSEGGNAAAESTTGVNGAAPGAVATTSGGLLSSLPPWLLAVVGAGVGVAIYVLVKHKKL